MTYVQVGGVFNSSGQCLCKFIKMITKEKALDLFKQNGCEVKLFEWSGKQQFDVYCEGEQIDYYVDESKLEDIDFVVNLIASAQYKKGFFAGEKSKAEEIRNSLNF